MTGTVKFQQTKGSRRALQWVNFFLADVRDGLGPFLAVFYLTSQHWSNAKVGFVLTVTGLSALIAQTPAGAFIDYTRHKRVTLIIVIVILVTTCAAGIFHPVYPFVVATKILMGIASSFVGPAIAGLTLGLVGIGHFTKQIGKNEAYNHAGNVVSSSLAGLIGYFVSYQSIVYVIALAGFFGMISLFFIRSEHIDHDVARGFKDDSRQHVKTSFIQVFTTCRPLLIFTICITLFHFANAAMLPMLGAELAIRDVKSSALFMSLCIVIAQTVMIFMAIFVGKKADVWGRKKIFLIAFMVLPIRGVLYTLWHNPFYMVSIQVLDGVGAGIFGALFFIVVADLTEGTGRYNISQGAVLTIMGLGASFSTTFAGVIADLTNYDDAFLALAGVAVIALIVFAIFMPETKGYEHPKQLTP